MRIHHLDFYLGVFADNALDVLDPVRICNQRHPRRRHVGAIIWAAIFANSSNFNQELFNGFFGVNINTNNSGPASANFVALYTCWQTLWSISKFLQILENITISRLVLWRIDNLRVRWEELHCSWSDFSIFAWRIEHPQVIVVFFTSFCFQLNQSERANLDFACSKEWVSKLISINEYEASLNCHWITILDDSSQCIIMRVLLNANAPIWANSDTTINWNDIPNAFLLQEIRDLAIRPGCLRLIISEYLVTYHCFWLDTNRQLLNWMLVWAKDLDVDFSGPELILHIYIVEVLFLSLWIDNGLSKWLELKQ